MAFFPINPISFQGTFYRLCPLHPTVDNVVTVDIADSFYADDYLTEISGCLNTNVQRSCGYSLNIYSSVKIKVISCVLNGYALLIALVTN